GVLVTLGEEAAEVVPAGPGRLCSHGSPVPRTPHGQRGPLGTPPRPKKLLRRAVTAQRVRGRHFTATLGHPLPPRRGRVPPHRVPSAAAWVIVAASCPSGRVIPIRLSVLLASLGLLSALDCASRWFAQPLPAAPGPAVRCSCFSRAALESP